MSTPHAPAAALSRLATEVVFREARTTDLPALKRLYLQLIPDEDPSFDDMGAALARIAARPEGGVVVVGTLSGEIVATCQVVIYDNLVRAPRVKAEIDSVVVDADHRGQGIGKRMMAWCVELLRQRNCSKIIVATGYKREVAHKVYSRMGFEEFGYSFVYSFPDEGHA